MRGWESIPLGALFRRTEDRGAPDLPLLSVYRDYGVVQRAGRDDNYNRPGDDLSAYKVVRPGDLVLNKMKTWQGSLGISRYEGIVSPAYFVARPVRTLEGRFVHHLLRSAPLIAEYAARSKGIRPSQWDLPWDEFKSIRVNLPPLSQQRAIADFLDAETARIDALIARKRSLIDLFGARRLSLTTAGVSGQLTAVGKRKACSIAWLEGIPEYWDEVGLTLVARLGSGHTPSRKRDDWWIESECTIPWITTGEVARLRSDRMEYIEETRENISSIGLGNSAAEVHPAGTVVLCRTASAGYSGIMRSDMATSQDFATWTCGPLLRPRFLLLCLRAMRNDLLGRLAMGSTHKTIYMPDIQSLRIPLPPIREQDEIVEVVWRQLDQDGHIEDLLTRQIDLLIERRQALITAAVTGELDVSDSIAKEAS